ncbi:MAG TPA: homocysteine S-methyltransferase family protein [Verrucomicrobiae bacterium]|nr:homocysteine S-methyltransferase family protein [Verrucomicrobiae bacterium]
MSDIPELLMPEGRPALLDGGMGRELRNRGVPILDTIWSANALLVAKDTVLQVHKDYIAAGADIITTNTYGIIRTELKKEGIEDKFVELNRLAGKLAITASRSSEEGVAVAASLPPLRGSYRPDLVGKFDEMVPLYREQAEILEPYCDLFICETMSSGEEARAAATAAGEFGRPVWVSFTLHDDKSGKLRSGETITEAAAKLKDLPVSGILANCAAPESIDAAMPELAKLGKVAGGYANTFQEVPKDWVMDGKKPTDGLLKLREDLDPEHYAAHAKAWLAAGARVIGGCCGTGPAHIARLKQLIESKK